MRRTTRARSNRTRSADLAERARETVWTRRREPGSGAACPFFISATSYPPMTSGTRARRVQTFGGCTFGPHHVLVDSMNQVMESNENKNTPTPYVICSADLERPQALEEMSLSTQSEAERVGFTSVCNPLHQADPTRRVWRRCGGSATGSVPRPDVPAPALAARPGSVPGACVRPVMPGSRSARSWRVGLAGRRTLRHRSGGRCR